MNTPTIEQIHQHGSARHYRPDPLPQALVEAIVVAGQRASTSSNLQMYSVIAVSAADKRERLQELCGGQQHIGQAPLFLTWVADLSRLDRVCAGRGYTQQAAYLEIFLQAAVDAAIAAQNAALAAESLGLGICYIGSIRNQPRQVIELLGLPRLTFPLVGMTVGWPATPPKVRPRLPLAAILHWEQYDPQNEAALIQQYDQAMIATEIYRGRQVTPEDTLPESEYGWSEHSARRVAQVMRPFLRAVLQEQGLELE